MVPIDVFDFSLTLADAPSIFKKSTLGIRPSSVNFWITIIDSRRGATVPCPFPLGSGVQEICNNLLKSNF